MPANRKAFGRVHEFEKMRPTLKRKVAAHKLIKPKGAPECREPCVMSAFQQWEDASLTPAWNYMFSFTVPAGKRLVIELVTAMIQVPAGENARLRMYTALPMGPSNLDLFVTPQGVVNGLSTYVATHYLRSYTDGFLEFNINRDNPFTPGYALICVSGHLVTP
jgi:hypothetical protein